MTELNHRGREYWLKLIGSFFIIIAVLTIDQIIKIWVHNHMDLDDPVGIPLIGNWFRMQYTENDGMAFGLLNEGGVVKTLLSLFRIVAVIALFIILFRLTKKNTKFSVLAGLSLITAGAMGNIIDCVFYGKIFHYAGWLHGKVIDMFLFDIRIFPFIFNFADAAITIGVLYMIIFQWKWLKTL